MEQKEKKRERGKTTTTTIQNHPKFILWAEKEEGRKKKELNDSANISYLQQNILSQSWLLGVANQGVGWSGNLFGSNQRKLEKGK